MRRSTVITLILFALVLAAGIFFNNRARQQAEAEATPEATLPPIEYLFTSADGTPNSMRIVSKAGEVVEVARNAENAWAVVLPDEAAADQGSSEAAATQVTTMRILERVPGLAPEAVGLDNPEYIFSFKFSGGSERVVEVGVLTPTQSGYYVRGEDGGIVIVSRGAVDALLGLLTSPPYAPTETPPPPTP